MDDILIFVYVYSGLACTRVSRYDPLFKKWRAAPKNGGNFAAAGPNNVRQGLTGRDSEKRKLRAARAGLIDDVNSLIFVGAKHVKARARPRQVRSC